MKYMLSVAEIQETNFVCSPVLVLLTAITATLLKSYRDFLEAGIWTWRLELCIIWAEFMIFVKGWN